MAQSVFRPNQLKKKDGTFKLNLVHEYTEPVEEVVAAEPVYEGPTVEDLQKEAEAYKVNWEAEKQKMLEEAQNSADAIVKKAEESAFTEVKRQTAHAQELKADAEKNAAEIVKKAQEQAQSIIQETQAQQAALHEKSYKEGFDEGREAGYKDGSEEAYRLVDRMHKILDAVMQRREEILSETEQQIVELVILMTRKVVKIISENQKSVIMNNVLQALKKVKGRGNITLRVNLADVKLTTDHIQLFLQKVENIKNITVLEDSSVEKGGCIVETDFGAIDARISSQLNELEQKILEVSPVKTISKTEALDTDR
jgi:flagellar assembly protein FliH